MKGLTVDPSGTKKEKHRRNSVLSQKGKKKPQKETKFKLLSDADSQVKNILSGFLNEIEPEDKQNLGVDRKLKEIKDSAIVDTSKLKLRRGSVSCFKTKYNEHFKNTQTFKDNKKIVNLTSSPKNLPNSSLSFFNKLKQRKNKKKDLCQTTTIQKLFSLGGGHEEENKNPKKTSLGFFNKLKQKKNNKKDLMQSNTLQKLFSLGGDDMPEQSNTLKQLDLKIDQELKDLSKDDKDNKGDLESMVPVFADNTEGGGGFISYSKGHLKAFQSLCSELKSTITTNKKVDVLLGKNRYQRVDLQRSDTNELFEKKSSINEQREKHYRKLFRKKNSIYDSDSVDEEHDEQIDDNYINPESTLKIIFDCMIAVFTIYSFVITPVEIAFLHLWNDEFRHLFFLFGIFIDISFIIDVFLGFYTAYFDLGDELIIDSKVIVKRYLTSWFVLDVITALPYSSLINFYLIFNKDSFFYESSYKMFYNYDLVLLHLLKLIKAMKLLKISVNNYLFQQIFNWTIESNVGKELLIYTTAAVFMICIHLLSCMFIFLGYQSYPNWIIAQNIEPKDYSEVYMAGLYFLCLTIFGIGYGDVLTTNINERIFNLFLLTVGLMLYSWLVSALSRIKEKMETNLDDEKISLFGQEIELLEKMKKEYPKMPIDLYFNIQRFIYYKYEKMENNPKVLFDNLPYNIQKALVFTMYKPVIENFVFFKKFYNEDFIMKVLTMFNPVIYYRKEKIVTAGEFMDEMYFVKKGRLAIDLPVPAQLSEQIVRAQKIKKMSRFGGGIDDDKPDPEEEFIKLLDIRTNEHYGDIMLCLNEPSPLNVRVGSKKVELYSLKKSDIVDLSTTYTNIWRDMVENSLHNMQQINLLIQKTLYFFYENNKRVLKSFSDALAFGPKKTDPDKINTLAFTQPNDILKNFLQNSNNVNNTNNSNSSMFNSQDNLLEHLESKKALVKISKKEGHEPLIEEQKEESNISSSKIDGGEVYNKNVIIPDESVYTINNELGKGESILSNYEVPKDIKVLLRREITNTKKDMERLFSVISASPKYFSVSDVNHKNKVDKTVNLMISGNKQLQQISSLKLPKISKRSRSLTKMIRIRNNSLSNVVNAKESFYHLETASSMQSSKDSRRSRKITKANSKERARRNPLLHHNKRSQSLNQVLSQIQGNILQSFQNLNDPDKFYSDAFSKIKNSNSKTSFCTVDIASLNKKLDSLLEMFKQI